MKGLVLAGLALALLVVGTAIALVFYRGGKEFKVFLGGFVVAVAIYALAFRLSPGTWASCRGPGLADPRVDFGNGLLILALVFHGYWTFCYFACVSPSMSVSWWP